MSREKKHRSARAGAQAFDVAIPRAWRRLSRHPLRLILQKRKADQPSAPQGNLPRINLRITAEGRSPELQCRVDCEASSSSDGAPIDNLIVAVKAFDVKAAIDGVASRLHEKSEIILLCNGALAVAEPFDRKGTPILVATTTHGVWSRGKQDVHHAGRGDTWIGQLGGGGDGKTPTAAQQLFASHGLGAIIEDALRPPSGGYGSSLRRTRCSTRSPLFGTCRMAWCSSAKRAARPPRLCVRRLAARRRADNRCSAADGV